MESVNTVGMAHPLAEAATVKIIQGITYNSESVKIDGKYIKDCSLEYSGGSVFLDESPLWIVITFFMDTRAKPHGTCGRQV